MHRCLDDNASNNSFWEFCFYTNDQIDKWFSQRRNSTLNKTIDTSMLSPSFKVDGNCVTGSPDGALLGVVALSYKQKPEHTCGIIVKDRRSKSIVFGIISQKGGSIHINYDSQSVSVEENNKTVKPAK